MSSGRIEKNAIFLLRLLQDRKIIKTTHEKNIKFLVEVAFNYLNNRRLLISDKEKTILTRQLQILKQIARVDEIAKARNLCSKLTKTTLRALILPLLSLIGL